MGYYRLGGLYTTGFVSSPFWKLHVRQGVSTLRVSGETLAWGTDSHLLSVLTWRKGLGSSWGVLAIHLMRTSHKDSTLMT